MRRAKTAFREKLSHQGLIGRRSLKQLCKAGAEALLTGN
jgi:hypothetical protein